MASWIYLYPLLLVALACVGIYEHRSTTRLSLPLSPALTVLAVLLPLFSLANTFALSARPLLSGRNPAHPATLSLIASFLRILQLLQLVLSVVLATLFFAAATPSAVRSCLLATAWQRLFAGKNGAAIRRIQDTLDCCGFNSVRDRAWPFAEDLKTGGGVACAERFGRGKSCAAPWAAVLQRNAGLDGGIAVSVTVLQVAIFLLIRWLNSRKQGGWPTSLLGSFAAIGNGEAPSATSRPLLNGYTDHADIADVEDEESGPTGQDDQVDQMPGNDTYGNNGPRVEPSHHVEGNAWETD